MDTLFYLQDSRSFTGNCVMWWAIDGKGYTSDIKNAQVYTKEESMAQYDMRGTDIPWPKDYIDAKVRNTIDMQDIKRSDLE